MNAIKIPSDLQQFVHAVVSSGIFKSESEVVAEGLRLLQKREQLRREVNEGIAQLERGEFTEYDESTLHKRFEQIMAEGRNRLRQETGGQ